MLTRIILALVDLSLAKPSCVSGVAATSELVNPIHASPVTARISRAVVLVGLASTSAESLRTVAGETVVGIPAGSSVVARAAHAVVQVVLAVLAAETSHAVALVRVDAVRADPAILARGAGALVYVNLAVIAGVTWHTDASESSSFVNAGSLVQAGIGVALVDVDLTPRAGEALGTPTFEGSGSVDTLAVMFAWSTCFKTFVDILIALCSIESWRAIAGVIPTHGIGVAPRPRVARITGAGILQMTQKPSFSRRTFAVKSANPIMTSSSIETVPLDTVILVGLAVPAHEPVDADALVAALGVLAGPVVHAGVGQATFIYVLRAVAARPLDGAFARVGVDSILALAAVLAQVALAVVDILLAIVAGKSGWTFAFVVVLADG